MRRTDALQSHNVIWWWFIQKRSEDKFTHLRVQLSSFSPHWLYKTMTRHLERQYKSDKSGPLFCLQYLPTTAVNKHHQGTNNAAKKAKRQARESPAISIVEKNKKIQILRYIISLGLFQMRKFGLEQDNRTLKPQRAVTDKRLT